MLARAKSLSSLGSAVTFAAICMVSASAHAGNPPTASEIKNAVSDHTYQGSMSAADSGFSEYYAPDGSIRANGYSGKWRVEDGTMCFQYGDSAERCFGVEVTGPSMIMIKGGKIDGNGMLIPGNVNNF